VEGSAWRLFDRVAAEYDIVVPFFAEFGAAIAAAVNPRMAATSSISAPGEVP
jgi:hypothetical protein